MQNDKYVYYNILYYANDPHIIYAPLAKTTIHSLANSYLPCIIQNIKV